MIRHIVSFQLRAEDPELRAQHVRELTTRLEGLVDVAPGILSIRVHPDLGLSHGHWPLILVSEFESLDSLETYLAHPRHVDVVDWAIDGIVSERAVVDFDLA